MRIVIAGGGAVGRHLAGDLLMRGHEVLLIEQEPTHLEIARESAPDVESVLGDACEPWVLEEAGLRTADVVVAATGDDEDNLVISLLAKQIQKDLTDKASQIAQGNESSLDPFAQMEKYVNESITLQIELDSQKAREKALKSIVQSYNAKLGSLPDKEFELAKYTREQDVNRKIYTMLLEKLEEAKISEAEQINPIRVIDKAQLTIEPISPHAKNYLAIGFLLGMILGVVIAFIIELKNNTIKSTTEVERLTEWPVIDALRLQGQPSAFPAHEIAIQHAERMRAAAVRFVPGLAAARFEDARVCWRPMPLDGYPVLGASPARPEVYLAVMHSGVTLAPIVGQYIAQEIVAGVPVESLNGFRPDRAP